MGNSRKIEVLEAGNGNPIFFITQKGLLLFTIKHPRIHKMSFHPQ